MTNWFKRMILGKKDGKKPKLKLDLWFVGFLAVLLWALGTILFRNYAFQIPYFLTDWSFWLRMATVVFAIFVWVWLFRIYIHSARQKQQTLIEVGKRLERVEDEVAPNHRLAALEEAIDKLKKGELPK